MNPEAWAAEGGSEHGGAAGDDPAGQDRDQQGAGVDIAGLAVEDHRQERGWPNDRFDYFFIAIFSLRCLYCSFPEKRIMLL